MKEIKFLRDTGNKPTVIFLDYFENFNEVVPIIRRICTKLKCKPIIVSSNFDTHPLLVYSDLKVFYFDEFLSSQDYKFMDRYVFNLTQNWYSRLESIEGITEYEGIQFGAIVEERAQRSFSSAIRNLEIILRIIEQFHPHRIILIGERDIFQNLSAFIKEELNTSSSFIEVREKKSSVSGIIKGFRRWAVEIISNVCDNLMRRLVFRKKGKDGIFIDTRLYFELKDLCQEYHPYLYLIEKGLHIRLRLIKDERFLFAPILVESFFKLPNVFNPFYRYWKFLRKEVKFQNIFEYKNLPIWRALKKFIRELIIRDFLQAKKNIIFLEKLYKRLVPKVVILREAVRMPEKTIVFVAKQAKIPTLVIQHGILAGRSIYTKLHCDKIAVWGNAGIDWYRAYGNDITKCIVTGKLQHDLFNLKKDNYEREREDPLLKIGINPDKQSILYLPAHFKLGKHQYNVYFSPDQEYIALNSILNIAKFFPDRQLIVKIHPFDSVDIRLLYNSKIKNRYPNVSIVKNVDLLFLIENSSLVITSLFSSVALNAVILNRPLITLNFHKREDLVPFAQRGVALGVTKSEHLCQAVRQIFEDRKLIDWFASNRESFIYDYAYKIDGKSSQRVKDLIRKLVHNK